MSETSDYMVIGFLIVCFVGLPLWYLFTRPSERYPTPGGKHDFEWWKEVRRVHNKGEYQRMIAAGKDPNKGEYLLLDYDIWLAELKAEKAAKDAENAEIEELVRTHGVAEIKDNPR